MKRQDAREEAVITSVSRMAWMNLPGLQMASEGTSLPAHLCPLLQGMESGQKIDTDVSRIVLALDWYLLVAQTQQPGEILSLVLAPRADATGSEEPNEEEKPLAKLGMFLPLYIPVVTGTGRDQRERRWVLMQQKVQCLGEVIGPEST